MVTTATLEIPKEQWPGFFDALSRTYEGWRATIELLGTDIGDQPIASDVPLQGISFESQGTQAGAVLIEAGDRTDAYMTHRVGSARSVRITDSQPGNEVDVEIESAEGPTTLVRLYRWSELPAPGMSESNYVETPAPYVERPRNWMPVALTILAGSCALAGIGILIYRQRQRASRRFGRRLSAALGWDYLRGCA